MGRSLLVALWFAILLLPFKGPSAALVVLAVVGVFAVSARFLAAPFISLALRTGPLWKRTREVAARPALRRLGLLGVLVVVASLPLFMTNYFLDIAILTGIYAILAIGLNVVVGYAGLLNLGFAAFYAIGAYSYALLNRALGLEFWYALPFCLCLTSFSGVILAIPALRLRGDYLAIVTLGFGEIVRLVLNNWNSLTNGPNGISGIAPPDLFGFSLAALNRYYYLVLIAVIISSVVVKRIEVSKIGRAWIAIREDEIAASAMGINAMRYKLYALAFGALLAGFAGALFAAKMQFVSPESFTFMESVLILSMVILGGLGSLPGVVIGAVILVMLPEALREVQGYRMLILGAGLILMMIFRPQGLVGRLGEESGR